MMTGLPASGKSTKAKEIVTGGGDFFRVNKDLLRTMLHFDNWNYRNEEIVKDIEQVIAARLLSKGHNVVVDDTNLRPQDAQEWAAITVNFGETFEVRDMMKGITVDDCLKRNEERGLKVPQSVIKLMALQNGYYGDRSVVVCDIDGTVADLSHRLHYVRTEGEKKDWKGFFSQMHLDTPRHEVYQRAAQLAAETGSLFVFVSARPDDYREATEQWLRDHDMHHDVLIMRTAGDKRPDTEVKYRIYRKYLKQYKVVKVFDDRPSVIRMWREHGLDVEDVGTGEEF